MLAILLIFPGCSIATSGCTLPVDIVIGDACFFGSVGGSLLIAAVFFVGIAIVALLYHWVKYIIFAFIRNLRDRR